MRWPRDGRNLGGGEPATAGVSIRGAASVLEGLLAGQHVKRHSCQAGMVLWGGIQTWQDKWT